MRVVLQRVSRAAVIIDGREVAAIERGVCIFLGVAQGDDAGDASYLARRTAELRLFPDAQGRFNLSLLEVKGSALVVSQFTLLADTRKGRRPNFVAAAPPAEAEPLVESFVQTLRSFGVPVETGRFGAHMLVEIHNDGPVTVTLDSKKA